MFNYSTELHKLNEKWEQLRIEYSNFGMPEEDIEEMYQFDLSLLRGDRRFYNHLSKENNENEDEEIANGLIQNIEDINNNNKEIKENCIWFERIEDRTLYEKINELKASDKELLILLVVEGYSKIEIAKLKNTSRQNIHNKIARIKKRLK